MSSQAWEHEPDQWIPTSTSGSRGLETGRDSHRVRSSVRWVVVFAADNAGDDRDLNWGREATPRLLAQARVPSSRTSSV